MALAIGGRGSRHCVCWRCQPVIWKGNSRVLDERGCSRRCSPERSSGVPFQTSQE